VAQRWATGVLERSPRPVQQAWRLIDRTRREVVDDRVPGLAAEVALFTLISLPALLLVVLGSLGFVAHALICSALLSSGHGEAAPAMASRVPPLLSGPESW